MDLKGPLNSKIHKKLILQIDSLHRYNMAESIDLLIVDEIESILLRM